MLCLCNWVNPQLQEQIKTVGDKTKGVTVTIAQEL